MASRPGAVVEQRTLGHACLSTSREATFGPAGAFAELCVCPEGHAARVPESINIPSEASLLKVAGLPLAGLTAYQALLTGGGCSTRGEPLGAITRGSKAPPLRSPTLPCPRTICMQLHVFPAQMSGCGRWGVRWASR